MSLLERFKNFTAAFSWQRTLLILIAILTIVSAGALSGYWYGFRKTRSVGDVILPPPEAPNIPIPKPVPPKPEPTPEPALSSGNGVPVLVLSYFPISDGQLNSEITGMGESLDTIRARVGALNLQIAESLEEGSTFHGYKDPAATPILDYQIIETKEFLTTMPLSDNEIPWNPGIYRPDYQKILTEIDICNYAENQGIKEIWIWGYHHGSLEPAESNMAGPYGDISNSERIDDIPTCSKTYTLYNYNYSRGLAEALEDHTHQIEAVLKHVDYDIFWNKFVSSCGWTHYPPNGKSDYDWYREEPALSDCEDWQPDGGGEAKQVNCHTWAGETCSDDGGVAFKIWWMQNLPPSWWDSIADFDQAVESGKRLNP